MSETRRPTDLLGREITPELYEQLTAPPNKRTAFDPSAIDWTEPVVDRVAAATDIVGGPFRDDQPTPTSVAPRALQRDSDTVTMTVGELRRIQALAEPITQARVAAAFEAWMKDSIGRGYGPDYAALERMGVSSLHPPKDYGSAPISAPEYAQRLAAGLFKYLEGA